MLALSWMVAERIARSRFRLSSASARFAMGAAALALLLCAETALAILAFEQSLSALLSSLTTTPGLLGLAGQVAFALIPWLQGHTRGA
ncbi:hypothetical protein K1T73_05995 [Roseovarius sp. SCSIO 43702]|uniref:hypothetical protein n=1 Tax=Roseovarius sp. SCSIO 43702 TaxID=2823043 RepID=UPI001C737E7C|nr:hypothetical protein [Roseovarius sp. SCSIO 43702]QYX57936.1 hypothetical protein K1T73_05995 [Roseovarius sp. SCSIO 43702]